jgi:arylsulfatase A-like enzyme
MTHKYILFPKFKRKLQRVLLGKPQRFVFSFLFCLFGFLIGAAVPLSRADTGKNVLLITIDTLRADRLSCYSTKHVPTPNIDSLAKEGVLFSRAFANTSTTLPSHTNILSGVSPLYHGVHDNLHFVVREDLLTLAEHLKANGYATAAYVGAYPLDSRFGLDQGFDIYDDEYPHRYDQGLSSLERRAEDVVAKAVEGLKRLNSPWFVWLHCYDPYLPYDPPEPFNSRFNNNPYDGEVAYVDSVLGKLMGYLKAQNLFDETMIIFTGDHGESLGQHGEMSHGFYAYNTTIWVPFIINVPGSDARRVQQNVSHLDIFPTVCDFVGIKKPSYLQGFSLLPALEGKLTEKC